MTELELKLTVPEASRERVRAALARGAVQVTRLRAAYADTPDERLARHAFALRLRLEGTRWVQTLKGRGDGVMQRLEHEVALPGRRRPLLDPARHAGTPAGDALARLLADGAPLVERYATDIRRTHRVLRSGGAAIEVAFDEGWIVAGERRLPVCELEFEWLSGPPAALPALAARWAARFGLVLDVRTKSERGHRLAAGQVHGPATPAPTGRPRRFEARLQAALAHVLPNAAERADGNPDPAVARELAQALQRLRRVLRSGDPSAAAWADALRGPFGPTALRDPAFTLLLLRVIALTLPPVSLRSRG